MSTINGVVIGLVTDVDDPDGRGKIKLHFPWLADHHETDWVRIATTMAGDGRGTFFLPEVGDEALVAFEHGDARFPFVIGFVWNGKDGPPARHVRERKIETKNGHAIRFLDASPNGGSLGALVIEDGHGNRITMSNGHLHLKSTCNVTIEGLTVTINGRLIAPTPNAI